MRFLRSFLLVFLLCCTAAFAQLGRGRVAAAELFIDTDPGTGQGTALSLQGGFNDAVRSAVQRLSPSLSSGLHTLNVRLQDSLGSWGTVFKSAFNVEASISSRPISAVVARAYWDADSVNAVNLVIVNGNATDAVSTFVNSTPIGTFSSPGLHKLNVQLSDGAGRYGSVFSTMLMVEAATVPRSITANLARVYWDNDSANATLMTFFNGTMNNAFNSYLPASAIPTFTSPGLHKLSIQVMDGLGRYGTAFRTLVKVEDSLTDLRKMKILSGRVWFDNDSSNAVALLALDGNLDNAVETAVQTLASPLNGTHAMRVQLRDSDNGWGPVFTNIVSVEGPLPYRNINVSAAQLYWDRDTTLGVINLVAFDGNFDHAVETAISQQTTSMISSGLHTLCFRMKDVAGNWGQPFYSTINVERPFTSRSINVIQGELRIDNNPPITIVALNGNFTAAVEQAQAAIIGSGIPTGLHQLHVRLKGSDNAWSPYFTSALLISPCVNSPTPSISASRPLTFCIGDSTVLTATPGYSTYEWYLNNSLVGTSPSLTVKTSGDYAVIVTDATGCHGTASVTTVVKTVSISGSPQFCPGTWDTLTASPGFTGYQWSNGSTGAQIQVGSNGTYLVTATDVSGCTTTASFSVSTLPAPPVPVITASGPLSFCYGGSVLLTSSAVSNIVWNNGLTTPTITADSSGVFTVTVTGFNGCKSTSLPYVTQEYPMMGNIVSPSGPLVFCADTSVVLSAITARSYRWSSGQTSTSIVVSTTGNYSVQIVDTNGCPAVSATVSVTVNPLPPTPQITSSGPLSFCNGTGITLSSSVTTNNIWSTGSTSATIFVSDSRTVTDTVYNQYGCMSWSSPLTTNVHPIASISSTGPQHFCDGRTDTLLAYPNQGATYRWFNGATTQHTSVVTAYDSAWVVVTETGSGCKDTVYFDVHPLPLGTITPGGPTTFCTGGSVTLQATGDAHTRYQWYQDGQPITYTVFNTFTGMPEVRFLYGNMCTASETGDYSALVIDTLTGCRQFTNTVHVTVNFPVKPVITATGGTTLCIGANSVLTSSSGPGYQWSTGATSASITASAEGYYWLLVTDANGCQRYSDSTLITFRPTALIVPSGPSSFCQGGSVDLSATPTGTYVWSNGSTATTLSAITVSGTYRVTVTDANGCTSTSPALSVVVNSLPNGSVILNSPAAICEGGSFSFSTSGTPNTRFKWYHNGYPIPYTSGLPDEYTFGYTYSTIHPGTYAAEVIDTLTGCAAMTNSVAVTIFNEPVATISQTAAILCYGENTAALQANCSVTPGPYSYHWNTGATNPLLQACSAGYYDIVITDINGCDDTAYFQVSQPNAVSPLLSSPSNSSGYQISCHGAADGEVYIAAGGTPSYTYSWSNGSTASYLDGLQPGTYSVVVTDANGCTGSGTVSLSEPDPVTVQFNSPVYAGGHTIRCHGGTGLITAIGGGGTTPYSYVWSTGDSSANLSNRPAGMYQVTVSDSDGCTTSGAFTLTEPAALTLALNATSYTGYHISCHGFSDGAIQPIVSGGTSPYGFYWNDSITTKDRSGLPSDTFRVIVSDTNGCQVNDSIVLNQPTAFEDSTIGSMLLCYGDSNGTASVLVTGGDPPYSYLWSNQAAGNSISRLAAASYSVTITDSRGCTTSAVALVGQPQQLQAYAFGTYIACGTQIGLLSGSASGGTSPYSYLWSNGSTTNYQTNLPVGGYHVKVNDANGCTDSANTVIVNPPVLVSGITQTYDSIAQTTTLSVQVAGGVSPYLYTWSDGSATPYLTVTNGTGGAYTVIVTDANGCTSSGTVIFGQPACALEATATQSNVTCAGLSNGSAAINVTGALGSVGYHWSHSSDSSSTVNHLSAGSYSVIVTDAANCSDTVEFSIVAPSPITITAAIVNPALCHGDSTAVRVTAAGGTVPYVSGTGDKLVVAGIQLFTVTDTNGCTGSAALTVTAPARLLLSVTSDSIPCHGGVAHVSLAASGGTPPYSFYGAQPTVTAGNYVFAVTDTNGCRDSRSITFSQPPSLVASATTDVILCKGDSAAVAVTATGGTRPYSGTLVYSMPAGAFSLPVTDANGCTATASGILAEPDALIAGPISVTTPISCYGGAACVFVPVSGGTFPYLGAGAVCSLPAGTHDLTVADANGCMSTTSVTLLEPPKLMVFVTSTQALCTSNNGTAIAVAYGGTIPYQYLWSNGQTTASISNLAPGSYVVTATDANGCTASASTLISRTTTVPGIPPPIIGPTGACRGTTLVYRTGRVASATSYRWILPSGASGSSTDTMITVNFGSLFNGGYICVQAVNGCGLSVQSCLSVRVFTTKPTNPGPITGPANPCGPNTYTYSVSPVATAMSYNWSVTGTGVTIVSGQGTNSIRLSVPAGFSKGSVSVNTVNCMGSSASSAVMTLIGVPVNSSPLYGTVFPCSNTTVSYSIDPVPGATSYYWTLSGVYPTNDASIISQNGRTCTISFGSNWNLNIAQYSILSVRVSNTCGQTVKNYILNRRPHIPGAITGPTVNLCGTTTAQYSIAPVYGANSYEWRIVNGPGISFLTPTNGTTVRLGFQNYTSDNSSLWVAAINQCGGKSDVRDIYLTSRPPIPGPITGANVVCKSVTNSPYSINPVPGATSYTWGTYYGTVTGSGTSISVNYSTGGIYYTNLLITLLKVTANNACGNGQPSGLYVSVNNYCRTAGRGSVVSNMDFYPNPTNGVVKLTFESQEPAFYKINIHDILGKPVYQENIEVLQGTNFRDLDLKDLAKGIYLLSLQQEGRETVTKRLVVE